MNELRVIDPTGDTKTIWDPSRPDEVENARETFRKLKAKGYIAYRVDQGGNKAEIMAEFDPQAGKVIMAPPVVGG